MNHTPMNTQIGFWNEWNAENRELEIQEVSDRQARVVVGWLRHLTGGFWKHKGPLKLIDVGCGSGWFTPQLLEFGYAVGTDLSGEVLARMHKRYPSVVYFPGDFMSDELDEILKPESFDVVVNFELLSHVADQPLLIAKLARLMKRGGQLMMSTQNAPVLRDLNDIPAPKPGQLRRWVDMAELRELLAPHFHIREMFTVTPRATKGYMRLATSYKIHKNVLAPLGLEKPWVSFLERHNLGWTIMCWAEKK
jgi:2-polyprenyl-3-methyl-5-hydroxy-6-metoxy-1,4-benzoquinol methylase